MKKLNNKGYTLMEVLAVVVIIAILGIIAIPSVLSTMNHSKANSYTLLIKNIKTASQQLFEELQSTNSELYYYDFSGKTTEVITIIEEPPEEDKSKKSITVNLQSLVSNGFLVGTNNEGSSSSNTNPKIILNPKNSKDIGNCYLTIRKIVDKTNNYQTTYELQNQSNENTDCPTTEEYK